MYKELTYYLLKSGYIKSERVAASEAINIIELVTTGKINEYSPHIHYPVKCDHSELPECITVHPTKHELHTVCLTCVRYLWGPNGEYPK